MRNIILPVFVAFLLLTIYENASCQGVYKWVDEKGTVHFSDNPTSRSSESNEVQQPPRENENAILKKLEFGNSQIPKDMRK